MGDNSYGSVVGGMGPTTPVGETLESAPRQTFSISEPSNRNNNAMTPLRFGSSTSRLMKSCCHGKQTDGFKVIVVSMFVFAVGVTVALIIQIASEPPPILHEADVVTSDSSTCSQIGRHVLEQGGNAVDAAIASTFCLAVVEPHLTGIGGGGMMLVHSHRKKTSVVIDFRETAPANAMNDRYIENPQQASFGRASIGVPGFVAGLEHAHKKYGSGHRGLYCCSWHDLVWKAIHIALKGVPVTKHFLNATHTKITTEQLLSQDATILRDLINPKGRELYDGDSFGDIPVYNEMVATLKAIAINGSDTMYNGGPVGQEMVQYLSGFITLEDLANYKVVERKPISTKIGPYEILASPAPSSGPELLTFLNTLEAYNKSVGLGAVTVEYLHELASVLERIDELQLGLGDPNNTDVNNRVQWMLDKANTARLLSGKEGDSVGFESNYDLAEPIAGHVAIMDKKDTYVSVVTSLNTWFGSKIMTRNGILLNNAMANFAIPSADSPELKTANQLYEGARPLTSSVVALSMDTSDICGVRIVTGGSTAASVGEVLSVPLLLKLNLQSSVEAARVEMRSHTVFVENAYSRGSLSPQILSDFRRTENAHIQALPYATVNAVEKHFDVVLGVNDFRSGQHPEDGDSDDYVL